MLRWLRFLLFAGLCIGALVPNGSAINQALRAAVSPLCFAPAIPCVPCALLLLGACFAYLLWLAGATVARWPMPLATHVAPLLLFVWMLTRGPLEIPADPFEGLGASERAIAAMRSLASESPASLCSREPGSDRLIERPGVPSTGYRAFGFRVPFRLVPSVGDGPVRAPQPQPGDEPGTLHLVCSPARDRFWISAVVAGSVRTDELALARDLVGKLAVVVPESAP